VPQTAARAGAALEPSTRWQVSEVLARYGHVVDNEEWKYLPLVFTDDAVLDAQYLTASGLAEIQRHLEASGPWRSHHTINTATKYFGDAGEITAWSRYLVVHADGLSVPGDYVDILVPTPAGWRIRHRRISARNRPDQAPDGQPWRTESFATWSSE
jgi:hypothetical protein